MIFSLVNSERAFTKLLLKFPFRNSFNKGTRKA